MNYGEARAIDVKIAQLLGYDARISDELEYVGRFDYQNEYMIVDGEVKPVPEYHTDLNAAMTLLDGVPDEWTPRIVRILQPTDQGMEYHWRCVIMSNVNDDSFDAYMQTPALAICRAWLTFKQQPGGG